MSFAAITFDNGKWETSFDCSEQTQYVATMDCDGLEWAGNWVYEDYLTQITSSANNSSGDGGRGARFWVGDGQNIGTGTIGVIFPENQKELWIRWYMRHETGFAWTSLLYDKHLYIYTPGGNETGTQVIPEFYGLTYYLLGAQGVPGKSDQVLTEENNGWTNIMGGDESDGEWHCYEIHIKMDTNQTNGIGQIWLDGELKASNTAVDWSYGKPDAQLGWEYFTFEDNQAYPGNGGAMSVDYDDIVVYTTTPPGRDANNNPYIGPIASSANPIVEILTTSGQTTTASVFQITGTATADTGLTISGVTCPGQTVTADDGTFDELSESWTCQAALSVGVNNLTFTGTDSVSNTGTDSIIVTRTEVPTSHSIGKGFYSNGINFK